MKRFIVFLCVSLFAFAVVAQEKFAVPTPTDLEKYQSSAWQWNGAYIILINYAKSLGKSAEDAGSSVGNIVKLTWNKEIGYDGFVKSMLYIWVTYAPQGVVEIKEQADKKIIFVVKNFYPPLKESLTEYNVTYEDYLKFLNNYVLQIAEYIGLKYSQNNTEEGLIVTIEKK